jgi:hypothetical protein
MIITFRLKDYDTQKDAEMVRLQSLLDRIDIEDRVAKKKQAVLLKSNARSD